MQLSGLVLDLYDDSTSLKEIWPSELDIPEVVKTAHVLSEEERSRLPDSSYALVLMNGEDRLRKYACVDAGNTVLGVAYLLTHGHKLPEEAQKIAAANLEQACEWYDLDMEKIAIGIGRALHLGLVGPAVASGTHGQVKENLAAINALESGPGVVGGRVVTPREMDKYGPAALAMKKRADVGLSHLQPGQEPANKKVEARKATIQKTASALPERKDASENLQTTEGTSGKQLEKLTQGKDLTPHVDVSNKAPPKVVKEKVAQHYAVPSIGAYPLDAYDEVQKAAAYFDEYSKRMAPEMRREFAIHMVKRAHELAIPVSNIAQRYGSETYAPEGEMKVAMDLRRKVVENPQILDMMEGLMTKQAEIDPEVFCETLAELDKLAEIDWRYDRDVVDPYLSVFGFEKNAEDTAWSEGADYVNKQQIENYTVTAFSALVGDYGQDFAKEFRKDPWGIFSSLPLDQKKRIARAATDNSPTGTVNVA